ncbi:hypothetical protein ACWGOQ_0002720 [Aquimarina sp. M1]
MNTKTRNGQFEVIDSFAIKRRSEFYLIGEIKEGTIEKNWFINVPFNDSFSLTVRISAIEDVEISSDKKIYKLLIVSGDEEEINILLGLNIGSEYLNITIEGND